MADTKPKKIADTRWGRVRIESNGTPETHKRTGFFGGPVAEVWDYGDKYLVHEVIPGGIFGPKVRQTWRPRETTTIIQDPK